MDRPKQIARLLQPLPKLRAPVHRRLPERLEGTMAMSKAFVEGLIAEHDGRLRKGHLSVTARSWYRDDAINIYIRVGVAYVEGRAAVNVLDIGSIEVERPYRNRGLFHAFMNEMEQMADRHHRVLRVESVINPWVAKWLQGRMGWQVSSTFDQNYFRPSVAMNLHPKSQGWKWAI